MANLTNTKTLFAFTSPRTIEKIIPEIKLLVQNFSGKEWDSENQASFYEDLYNSDFFDASSKAKDLALAARDRITRAPKALGFVDLKPKIQLTQAGEKLISEKRIYETITKQLLKFQLPSPYHTDKTGYFFVRPYLEFLRLIKVIGGISKTETAIFFTQLTHINKFDSIVKKILDFRDKRTKWKGNRKAFIEQFFKDEILQIYSDEIESQDIETRESSDISLNKFIVTKKQNMVDYADAFIRYLRATLLVTFESRTYRMIISPSKIDEVEFILQNTKREPVLFTSEKDFKEYLFSGYNISLLSDNREFLIKKLDKLRVSFNKKEAKIEELKDLLENVEEEIKKEKIQKVSKELKNYKEYDDIIEVFDKIQNKEVPDAPLYFEWNVWRAMTMLNYALSINGNFTIDIDGVPLNTASSNKPDIEIEYDTFKLIVEVTLSSGNKQYEMEGEPVARHFGIIQKESTKPAFCLFIAPKVSEATLGHFFITNQKKVKFYGGTTKIIPMNINHFIQFIKTAKNNSFSDAKVLGKYFDYIIKQVTTAEDEAFWFNQIEESTKNWLKKDAY
ncbi:MAG: AlwI family type II restriction endonuclease [Microscillaceae bacterium]|jgi:hypothetical protein|nr:AlwI family type II restriction endonuclease [Microscillaceae bacterium]